VLFARRQDVVQAGGHVGQALEPRIAQAVAVIDLDHAVAVAVLDQQLDQGSVRLGGGGDRFLQLVAVIGFAIDRDDRLAGGQAGLEGGAVPVDAGVKPSE